MENAQEAVKPEKVQKRGKEKGRGNLPTGAEKQPGKKHFEIDIFRGWCKSCGICAAFCPRECISIDAEGSPSVSDSSRCTGCGWCELHCPDFAISVRGGHSEPASSEDAS